MSGSVREALAVPTEGPRLPEVPQPGARPLPPRINRLTAPFWQRLEQGAFDLARCEDCARLTFPPKLQCPGCGSSRMGWLPASGLGVVHSVTTVHAAPATFAAMAPYTLVVLDLAEGVRLLTRWVGPAPACDAPARLVVLRHDDGVLFGATAA